jgi:hypothetical protein
MVTFPLQSHANYTLHSHPNLPVKGSKEAKNKNAFPFGEMRFFVHVHENVQNDSTFLFFHFVFMKFGKKLPVFLKGAQA